jgi:16S rRNA U1498 N3-methylase RsmE
MIEKTAEMDCTGYILLDTEFSQNVKKRSKGTPATRLPAFNKLQMYTMEAAEQCERLNLPQFVTIQTPHVSQTAPSSPNRSVDGDPAANVLFQEPKSRESKQETSTETTSLLDFLQAWLEPGTTSFDGNVKLLACRERANGIPVWEALESIFDGENEAADETAPSTVIFLIGPEGGWSPSEEAMMDQLERSRPNSFVNVSLGPTVLRTETAAMFAMATYSLYNDYHRRQRRKKSNAL